MTLTINLSDEEAVALQTKAAAEGLSVEEWVHQRIQITPSPAADRPLETAAEIILSRMRDVPPELMAKMPSDGASQHDHYIYGWPKKEA
jgi:hypothetical protein